MLNVQYIRQRMSELGTNFAQLGAGITQIKGGRNNVTKYQIKIWLENKSNPSMENLVAMAHVLKCKVDDIIVKKEEDFPVQVSEKGR